MSAPVPGTVYCGDALSVMRKWEGRCFDWVITDPPYGMDAGKLNALNGKAGNLAVNSNYGGFTWDDARPSPNHFAEIRRISHAQIIFGGNFFADLLPPSRCWVTWDKGRRNDFADCELAWVSVDQPARVLNYHYDGCMTQEPRRELPRVHPTQKPIPVMEWLINRFTQPGDFILDPFCGSGTTLTAAERLDRRWVGIDIDPRWCNIARKRTAQRGLGLEVAV